MRGMRLATWNVNALRARLDFVLHWLRARKPDVVGLQELKTEDERFPHDVFEEAGYHVAVHGQKGWNGVAILSRTPLEEVAAGLPGEEAMGARLISARTAGLRFTTVYVPNGKTLEHADFPKKLAWLDRLADWLAARERAEADVLCGDFNIVPAAIDSWREAPDRIFHTPEERARLARIVDLGFVDLFRGLHPEKKMFSWWDYRGGAFHRNLGLRIDLLLGTPSVLARATAVEIDRDYRKKKDGLIASDHAPVLLDLEGS